MTGHPSVETVTVFADVTCPFAHVGLRRFLAARAARGRRDPLLRVRAWPLELVNGAPLDAESTAEKIEVLRDSVAPDLFAGFDPSRFPTTSLPALDLIAAAYERDACTGERASVAVRTALFEEGRDVGDADELDALRGCLGLGPSGPLDRSRVLADWHTGQSRGVEGSPHFFVGRQGFFCPALDIEHVDERLVVRTDPRQFRDFLEAAFAS